jgi:hypothetical protein
MKALSRLVVVSVMLAVLLVPLATMSDQLPAPLIKTVFPPQETIYYADQTLKFTTTVPLKVDLIALGPGKVRLKFKAAEIRGGASAAPSAMTLQIYWENWDNEIYNGYPPTTEPWDGILNTESGFTEK